MIFEIAVLELLQVEGYETCLKITFLFCFT